MEKPILIKDLGMQFPNLKSKQRYRMGIFKCFCGEKFTCEFYKIKTERKNSCGCLRKINTNIANQTHKMTNHRIYRIYWGIISRCRNKNNSHYRYYGGRGIEICSEWENDFMAFYNWSINSNYNENLTIDRKDNDKGYSPSNCRWTTFTVQNQNNSLLRSSNTSGYRGVSWSKKDNVWHTYINVNKKRVNIGYFKCRLQGAYAYDNYVRENNLIHPVNFSTTNVQS